jgi:molybdopterin molybdotransferase
VKPDLFREPLAFDVALAAVRAHVRPVSRAEVVSLEAIPARVAAEDVVAPLDVPAFDRSAMDGYAVQASSIATSGSVSPITLTCVGSISAGDWPGRTLGSGECIEIATGAPIPQGADAVVIVEETSREGDAVTIRKPVRVGQNVGPRGADIAKGQLIVRAGDFVTPARAGALAAVGVDQLSVFARPTVAVLATGSEVASRGTPLAPGQVHDVNTVTLSAVIAAHGCIASVIGTVPDAIDTLRDHLKVAAAHDLIVCSGGSSVGSRDLLTEALIDDGRIVFHGIAMKPGKPTLFGSWGDTPLFGLPGNPTSCLSNAYLLLVPYLRAAARWPPWRPTKIEGLLATRIASTAGRHQFYSVRVHGSDVFPAFKSSGDITSMAHADGYIEIPADVSTVEAGTPVTVTLF